MVGTIQNCLREENQKKKKKKTGGGGKKIKKGGKGNWGREREMCLKGLVFFRGSNCW